MSWGKTPIRRIAFISERSHMTSHATNMGRVLSKAECATLDGQELFVAQRVLNDLDRFVNFGSLKEVKVSRAPPA